jgi:hypothetical protein
MTPIYESEIRAVLAAMELSVAVVVA